jgi:copper(I)-binding protein
MKNGLLAIALIGLAVWAQAAQAMDYRVKDLTVSHPWARATAGPARVGAAYLTITNHGTAMDRLLAVATPTAKHAGVHATIMDQGIMKMRPVKAVEVHPGEPAVLRPGGMHVMLMGLTAPLKKGQSFPLTLTFESAGTVEVMVTVKGAGSMGDMDKAPMEHRQHGS